MDADDPIRKAAEKLIAEAREAFAVVVERIGQLETLLSRPVEAASRHQIKEALSVFDQLWRERYRKPYVFSGGKDAGNAKRILLVFAKTYPDPLAEFKIRATRFLASEDPFYTRSGHAFGVFVTSINGVASASKGTGNRVVGHAAPTERKYSDLFREPGGTDDGSETTEPLSADRESRLDQSADLPQSSVARGRHHL